MGVSVQQLTVLLSQYEREWSTYAAQLEHKVQLLRTLKQGMELLLLVSSYLIYYLVDCVAQIMALPLPLVR